jgi:Ca2+-binding EF-hand superfamily protein
MEPDGLASARSSSKKKLLNIGQRKSRTANALNLYDDDSLAERRKQRKAARARDAERQRRKDIERQKELARRRKDRATRRGDDLALDDPDVFAYATPSTGSTKNRAKNDDAPPADIDPDLLQQFMQFQQFQRMQSMYRMQQLGDFERKKRELTEDSTTSVDQSNQNAMDSAAFDTYSSESDNDRARGRQRRKARHDRGRSRDRDRDRGRRDRGTRRSRRSKYSDESESYSRSPSRSPSSYSDDDNIRGDGNRSRGRRSRSKRRHGSRHRGHVSDSDGRADSRSQSQSDSEDDHRQSHRHRHGNSRSDKRHDRGSRTKDRDSYDEDNRGRGRGRGRDHDRDRDRTRRDGRQHRQQDSELSDHSDAGPQTWRSKDVAERDPQVIAAQELDAVRERYGRGKRIVDAVTSIQSRWRGVIARRQVVKKLHNFTLKRHRAAKIAARAWKAFRLRRSIAMRIEARREKELQQHKDLQAGYYDNDAARIDGSHVSPEPSMSGLDYKHRDERPRSDEDSNYSDSYSGSSVSGSYSGSDHDQSELFDDDFETQASQAARAALRIGDDTGISAAEKAKLKDKGRAEYEAEMAASGFHNTDEDAAQRSNQTPGIGMPARHRDQAGLSEEEKRRVEREHFENLETEDSVVVDHGDALSTNDADIMNGDGPPDADTVAKHGRGPAFEIQPDALATISADELEDIRIAFYTFSEEHEQIGVDQMGPFLRAIGQFPTQLEISHMTSEMDADADGFVTLVEFLSWFKKRKTLFEHDQLLLELFNLFDLNQSGNVHSSELQHVMAARLCPLTDEEAQEMVRAVDDDFDGQVNLEEFIEIARGWL